MALESQRNRVHSRSRKQRLRPISIHDEARSGNIDKVKYLLETRRSAVDAQDCNGKTALMLAVEGSHNSIVSLLLQYDCNIYLEDKSGKSALRMALALGLTDVRIVESFLSALKAECSNDAQQLSMKLIDVECPLYHAALLKDINVMREMLQNACIDVDSKDPVTFKTALHVAVGLKDYESIKLLIENGADVNALDSDEKIPFAYYQTFDDSERELEMLEMFFERDTSFTIRNRRGSMQLACALEIGQRKSVQMFLRSVNVDWCATNACGFTPLYYLASNEMLVDNQDILEDLRDKNINAARDCRNNKALMSASQNCIATLVEILLDNGVAPNYQNPSKFTPLFVASRFMGNSEQIEDNKKTFMCLLQYGADPQIRGIYDHTVFDSIIVFRNFHLAESALGQLAISECLGVVVTDYVQSTINSHEFLRSQFQLCKLQLEQLKNVMVHGTVSLFEVLIANERTLVAYTRNGEFCMNWTSKSACCPHSYYAHVLQTKFQKTMRIVRLKRNIDDIVCEIMRVRYDSYPAIIDKITNYVIF